jgi:hypothetical protein
MNYLIEILFLFCFGANNPVFYFSMSEFRRIPKIAIENQYPNSNNKQPENELHNLI